MADKEMHVDDFIDSHFHRKDEEGVLYARWFLNLHRLSASLQADFDPWITQYKLFCTYKRKRYRVTGCSRLGDVWLVKDQLRDSGYDHRVDINDCHNFGGDTNER